MIKKGRRAFWYEEVKALPLQKPTRLMATNTVQECIEAMQESGLGCVFIVDDEKKIAGIFTDRDVMKHFVASSLPGSTAVESIMSKDVITIQSTTEVVEAVEIFHEKNIRHLPVVDDQSGQVKGLLSARVLMDYIAENLPGEVLNLPPDSTIVAKETEGG